MLAQKLRILRELWDVDVTSLPNAASGTMPRTGPRTIARARLRARRVRLSVREPHCADMPHVGGRAASAAAGTFARA